MKKKPAVALLIAVSLLICFCVAGCSDTKASGDAASETTIAPADMNGAASEKPTKRRPRPRRPLIPTRNSQSFTSPRAWVSTGASRSPTP
jgi:ABC-type uncharacterized transport system auxiliary subunit